MEKHKMPLPRVPRYCIVPKCKNTTRNAPDKVFLLVPRGEIRNKWCEIVKRNMLSPSTSLYCCEDHFNIEEDTVNYTEYQMKTKHMNQKAVLRLKKGILPHKFECHKDIDPPIKTQDHQKLLTKKTVHREDISEDSSSSDDASANTWSHPTHLHTEKQYLPNRFPARVTVQGAWVRSVKGPQEEDGLEKYLQFKPRAEPDKSTSLKNVSKQPITKYNSCKEKLPKLTPGASGSKDRVPLQSSMDDLYTGLDGEASCDSNPTCSASADQTVKPCCFCRKLHKDYLNVTDQPYVTSNRTILTLNNVSITLNFNNDSTPKNVCRDCDTRLLEMFDFFKVVQEAQDELNNKLNNFINDQSLMSDCDDFNDNITNSNEESVCESDSESLQSSGHKKRGAELDMIEVKKKRVDDLDSLSLNNDNINLVNETDQEVLKPEEIGVNEFVIEVSAVSTNIDGTVKVKEEIEESNNDELIHDKEVKTEVSEEDGEGDIMMVMKEESYDCVKEEMFETDDTAYRET